MSIYVPRAERLRRLRLELYEALLDDGRWVPAREAHALLYARLGAPVSDDGCLLPGFVYAVDESWPIVTPWGLSYHLRKLHDAEMVERQRVNARRVLWRAVRPEPTPAAPPPDWARTPVAA